MGSVQYIASHRIPSPDPSPLTQHPRTPCSLSSSVRAQRPSGSAGPHRRSPHSSHRSTSLAGNMGRTSRDGSDGIWDCCRISWDGELVRCSGRGGGWLNGRSRQQNGPFLPGFSFAVRLLILVRVTAAMYSNIQDCDEGASSNGPLPSRSSPPLIRPRSVQLFRAVALFPV